MPENAHNGKQNVKFAGDLDRSCDYVLQNFSDCAAIVPLDPDKVLSPANAAVVDMETAMLAVRWLTGRLGWMMQVLQCGAPADGVEGRG